MTPPTPFTAPGFVECPRCGQFFFDSWLRKAMRSYVRHFHRRHGSSPRIRGSAGWL